MTSKEALCYLDDIAHGRKMTLDPHELKLIVEKDLEVLSLLKKYSRFIKGWYGDQANWSYDEILIRIENTDRWNKGEKEDFKIIKEWIDNDN